MHHTTLVKMSKNYYGFKKPTPEEKLEMIRAIMEDRYDDLNPPELIHLGKYSGFTGFYFNHKDWKNWSNLAELRKFVEGLDLIEDEYGRPISKYRFWKMVVENRNAELDNRRYVKVDWVWCHRDGGAWS